MVYYLLSLMLTCMAQDIEYSVTDMYVTNQSVSETGIFLSIYVFSWRDWTFIDFGPIMYSTDLCFIFCSVPFEFEFEFQFDNQHITIITILDLPCSLSSGPLSVPWIKFNPPSMVKEPRAQ